MLHSFRLILYLFKKNIKLLTESLFSPFSQMDTHYRFILGNGKFKKLHCPQCNRPKHWQRYIDTQTDEAIDEQYGRCDNQIKCGYSKNPYTDGFAKLTNEFEKGIYSASISHRELNKRNKLPVNTEPVFIPQEVLTQTLKGYQLNGFIQNLLRNVQYIFEPEDIERVISQYYLGTVCHGYRTGAITFPFIDSSGNIRTIQVKEFDRDNHTKGTDFIHSIIANFYKSKNEKLPAWLGTYQMNRLKVSCLFGEHLLSKYPLNPIALVEAPKSAIYGTLYFGFPENPKNLLWLAVYNLSSINFEKCKALQGRDVYLFPDLSKDGIAFKLWSKKAKELTELMPETLFRVSDLLEKLATDEQREGGEDMADVLIKLDWRQFRS